MVGEGGSSDGNTGPYRWGTAAGQTAFVVEACVPPSDVEGAAGSFAAADQTGSARHRRQQDFQGVARRPVLYQRLVEMLHEALRLIRVYHDLKQAELADKLGISKSYMSEIEKGVKSPSVELINKYAEIFGMPASSILFFSENMDKPMAETTARQARTFVAAKIIKLLQFLEERSGHARVD